CFNWFYQDVTANIRNYSLSGGLYHTIILHIIRILAKFEKRRSLMPVPPRSCPYAFRDGYLLGGAKGSLCVLLFFSGFTLAAQERGVVPDEPNQLFYLQRDPDDNTVIY